MPEYTKLKIIITQLHNPYPLELTLLLKLRFKKIQQSKSLKRKENMKLLTSVKSQKLNLFSTTIRLNPQCNEIHHEQYQ